MAYRYAQHRQGGFSLDEALVSLTLLSSGLFTLAQFQGQIQEQSSNTKAQTTAVSLARQKLEELRNLAISDYTGLIGGSDTPAANPGDTSQFQRRWTVTPHTAPDYKEVGVTTNWQAIDGTSQTATIQSFFTASAPYVSRHWTDSNDEDESGTPSEESTETAVPDTAEQADAQTDSAEETDSTRVATCLCQLGASDGGAQLDPRNSNADCSSDCCQGSSSKDSAGICQSDGCTFVAQCSVST